MPPRISRRRLLRGETFERLLERVLLRAMRAAGLEGGVMTLGPTTALHRMIQSIDADVAGPWGDAARAFLRENTQREGGFAKTVDGMREEFARMRVSFASDPVGHRVLALYDNSTPFGRGLRSLAIAASPELDAEQQLDLHQQLERLASLDEERRARALFGVLPVLIDGLYERYLTCLLCLDRLAQGEFPKGPLPLGMMVNQLAPRLADCPGIVDPDIAHIRNAAAHVHWGYSPTTGKILLWDRASPALEGAGDRWEEELSVDAFEARIRSIHRAAVGRLHDLRQIDAYELVIPLLATIDPNLVDRALEGASHAVTELLAWRPDVSVLDGEGRPTPKDAKIWFGPGATRR